MRGEETREEKHWIDNKQWWFIHSPKLKSVCVSNVLISLTTNEARNVVLSSHDVKTIKKWRLLPVLITQLFTVTKLNKIDIIVFQVRFFNCLVIKSQLQLCSYSSFSKEQWKTLVIINLFLTHLFRINNIDIVEEVK